MKNYETVFILTPVLSEDQMKDAVKKYVKVLKDAGAKIENEEIWGLKKLAYQIQHKSTGFYNLLEYSIVVGSLDHRVKVHAHLVKHGHGSTAAGTKYTTTGMLERTHKV